MPEGPSLIIFKEELKHFKGKKIRHASGTEKGFDPGLLEAHTITAIKTWGKHLLLCLGPELTLRIHFMMFGSFLINDTRSLDPKLHLEFAGGETLNFYTTNMKILEGKPEDFYNWQTDILDQDWDNKLALTHLEEQPPQRMICDVLMDQDLFSGLGNIIKNEVLFRARIHPESHTGDIPLAKRKELVNAVIEYAKEFLKYRKAGTLSKHWEAYEQKICPRDHIPFHKEPTGKGKRTSFFCNQCQKRYGK